MVPPEGRAFGGRRARQYPISECDVMMPSMKSAARGRSLFIQVAAKKHGWQCVTKYDEARTNSKGHVKTFLTHTSNIGVRQEGLNISFAICAGFLVIGDALPPVLLCCNLNEVRSATSCRIHATHYQVAFRAEDPDGLVVPQMCDLQKLPATIARLAVPLNLLQMNEQSSRR